MQQIKRIVVDVDGCLTDGKVYYTHDGKRIKGFHSRDIRALREFVSKGIEVVLLTQSSWPGMEEYADRTGAQVVVERNKDSWVANNRDVPYIAIGDDAPDIQLLSCAVEAYCPIDADPSVRAIDGIKGLPMRGGGGLLAGLGYRLFCKKKAVVNY